MRRGKRIGVLLAVLAVIPGLVAGSVYISSGSSPTLTTTPSGVSAISCAWDTLSNTTDSSTWVTVTAGASATLTFDVVKSATYEYLVDEMALVCTLPGSFHNVYINLTATTAATAYTGASWLYANFQGFSTVNAGTGSGAGTVWTPTASPNAVLNPTSKTACDTSGGGVYIPWTGQTAGKAAESWTYSLNATVGWTYDGCNSNAAGGAPTSIDVTSGTGSFAYFYVSFGATSVASGGPSGGTAPVFTAGTAVN